MVTTFFSRVLNVFGIPIPRQIGIKIIKTGFIAVVAVVGCILALKALGVPDYVEAGVFGVPTHFSLWTLLMVVLFWIDSSLYIRKFHQKGREASYILASATVACLVVVSVVIHELGHGYASTIFGNNIESAGISWWGAFVRPTSALYETPPWEEVIVALAGPFTNILLGMISALIVWAKGESLPENTAQYFAVINFRLAKYNLIPMFIIFDGGKALEGFLRMFGVGEQSMGWMIRVVGFIILAEYFILTRGVKSLESRLAEL